MKMRSEAPFSQMPKDELMREIQAHSFSVRDLALFLDTHPDDADALEHFAVQTAATGSARICGLFC